MPGKLLGELRQNRPFSTPEEEAALNVTRTAGRLEREIASVLKPFDLSAVQYNVLRILRGAGREGAHCKDVGERMVTPDPDVTRLVDRLEKRGLVARARGARDRRYVTVSITPAGMDLLARLDEPMRDVSRRMLGHLGAGRIATLIELLEEVRQADS